MKKRAAIFALSAALPAAALIVATLVQIHPIHKTFLQVKADIGRLQVLDRDGRPLSVSVHRDWNRDDTFDLHQIPQFLPIAFIVSEDKRFYRHRGPDWAARVAALRQNLRAGRSVRGASTISEQVVRMVHPRARTLWARWLEGWEAGALERRVGKEAILEFYLNQVPYAANRRGVAQAARYYFDRSPETLSRKEMLALAVLVRAPSRLDPYRNPEGLEPLMGRLADALVREGAWDEKEKARVARQPLALQKPTLVPRAVEFSRYVMTRPETLAAGAAGRVRTTLDGDLQRQVQALLDTRLDALAGKKVRNGAVLLADHQTGEILAWAVAHGRRQDRPGSFIDAVITPRQPGSALKPFVYALALDRGWTPATLIDDAPLIEWVGRGLHRYQNYSRRFHGPVTLRQALGNSLNIPALKAVQFLGAGDYLALLRSLGFDNLDRHPDFYGDGIALGNGEVSLLELVGAYGALAGRGLYRPLAVLADAPPAVPPRRVFSKEAADLIANILADPDARQLEFGRASVLNLPVQTAVKTGTSSDYRDAWSVGFNDRYLVGVWMGNLDQQATDGLTGASGPALLMRAVFAELNRFRRTAPLPLSPKLAARAVCIDSGRLRGADDACESRPEWFMAETLARDATMGARKGAGAVAGDPLPRLRQPSNGLHLAMDPRLPADKQAFEFVVDGLESGDRIQWRMDENQEFWSTGGRHLWPLVRGSHRLSAAVWRGEYKIADLGPVGFVVK